MAYGINDVVQDKVDAYRGNPAALQKSHAASKELIDLLALQKLKSERDSASRQLQMQVDNKPQTIAKQMEAELVGQTKNEMLQGVAGVMKTNQAKQQANMQRMASAGLPKSAAAASPQGLAAQPKPNMQQMAQGGIVGYAKGKDVSAIRAKLLAEVNARNISDAEKNQLVSQINDIDSKLLADQARVGGDVTLQDFGIGANQQVPNVAKSNDPTLAPPSQVQYPMGAGVKKAPPYVPDAMGGTGDDMMRGLGGPAIEPPEVKPEDGLAGLKTAVDNVPKPIGIAIPESKLPAFNANDYKPDMTKANEYNKGLADKFTGLMNQDPAAAAAAKRKEALAYMDYTDAEKTLRKANIDELVGIEKKRYGSEDQLRRDRLIQNLINAGGSTVGGALASGARGSIAERDKQRAGIDSLMAARQKLQTEQMDKSQAIRKDAYGEGTSAENQAYQNIRAGVDGLRGLGSDETKKAVADADRLLAARVAAENRDTANRQMELKATLQIADQAFRGNLAKYKGDVTVAVKTIEAVMAKEKNDITAQHNAAMQAIYQGQGKTQLTNVIAKIGQTIGTIEKHYVDAFAPMMAEAAAGKDRKEYKGPTVAELQAQIDKAVEASTKDLTKLLDDSKQRLDGGSSNDGYTVNTI